MAKPKRLHSNDNDSDAPNPRGRGRGRGRGRSRGGFSDSLSRGGTRGRGALRGTPTHIFGRTTYQSMQDVDADIQQWPESSGSGFNLPRGRGGFSASPSRGGTRGRGALKGTPIHTSGRTTYQYMQDVDIQQWQSSGSGFNSPRGRGRGSSSNRGGNSRGSFDNFPRGAAMGRGRGNFTRGSKPGLNSRAPLSSLLYEDRPLLRPVIFVRSQHTATLFEEAEDIFEPVVENSTQVEESHVPTASRVARVFSGSEPPPGFEVDDELEEVDFNDLGRIREQVEEAVKNVPKPATVVEVEEKFTGFYIDTKSSIHSPYRDPAILQISGDSRAESTTSSDEQATAPSAIDVTTKAVDHMLVDVKVQSTLSINGLSMSIQTTQDVPLLDIEQRTQVKHLDDPPETQLTPEIVETRDTEVTIEVDDAPSGFYIDTKPSLQVHDGTVEFNSINQKEPLGAQLDDGDDIIVYDAPNPRSGPATPAPKPSITLADISFVDSPRPCLTRKVNPARRGTFFERVSRTGKGRAARRRLSGHAAFGTFGAAMAEARLRLEEDDDPRREDRRMGDSDVDWGDDDEDEGNMNAVAEGMDLDPDLVGAGISVQALKNFVHGVSGEGSQFVTMDDLEDMQGMQAEQASSDSENSDGEGEEDLISDEERMLLAELEEDSSFYDEDSSDEDASPKAGFQARLEKLRKREPKNVEDFNIPDYGGEDSMDEFIDDMELFMEKNGTKLSHKSPHIRSVFQAIRDGYFDDPAHVTPSKQNKNRDLSPELQEQWEKDRAKKAKKKQERELERLIAVMDPATPRKGGKKSRKATIAAAKLNPSIDIPHRIIDMESLELQIRRFIADASRSSMPLPATDKATRQKVHILAGAFNLKSKSNGKGTGRSTTLIKTKHTGYALNEKKIAGMMKGFKARASYDGPAWKGKGNQDFSGQPKTQDGDVVGRAAPKIDQSNIGFKMLALMGWADGDTIGLSGGLDAPIAAIIKKTKLGLGALKYNN